ncbi:MAG: hypothetical protein KDE33_14085 [Bacteroidetes bacterium]|nr:hypothetical protein [Bacteroidota bacterium]MCB9226462.1 hypothetical protein [Chitinophagales bacterium]
MRKLSFILLVFVVLFSCSKDNSDIYTENPNGTGGSMARFVLVDNYLYVVDNSSLATYDVSNEASPVLKNKQDVGFGIETLYPFEGYLLIGSTTGMFIYETDVNGVPMQLSNYEHIETCDPVVAQGDYAYVTLRSNRVCGGNISQNNRLEIINIQNPTSPYMVNTIPMNNPKGLAVDNDLLFICVDNTGIDVYDISQPTQPSLVANIPGFTANDVIAKNNHLLVVCTDGLRQFNYNDVNNITNLSYFAVNF